MIRFNPRLEKLIDFLTCINYVVVFDNGKNKSSPSLKVKRRAVLDNVQVHVIGTKVAATFRYLFPLNESFL